MKVFIKKITYSGIEFAKNAHDKKSILIINRMSLVLVFLMLMFMGIAPFLKAYQILYFAIPFFFVFSMPPMFLARGWLTFTKYYFTFCPVISLVILCFFNNINLGDRFFFLNTATIPIILFRKTWTVYLLFYVSVAAFLFTSWYQSTHEPITSIPKEYETYYFYFTILSVFAVMFYVVRYFKGDSEDHEREIEERNLIITEKSREVRESIEYASRIQRALITSERYIEKQLKKLKGES